MINSHYECIYECPSTNTLMVTLITSSSLKPIPAKRCDEQHYNYTKKVTISAVIAIQIEALE